jgi:hypothetical protein
MVTSYLLIINKILVEAVYLARTINFAFGRVATRSEALAISSLSSSHKEV